MSKQTTQFKQNGVMHNVPCCFISNSTPHYVLSHLFELRRLFAHKMVQFKKKCIVENLQSNLFFL
jgi:hypothetical protein